MSHGLVSNHIVGEGGNNTNLSSFLSVWPRCAVAWPSTIAANAATSAAKLYDPWHRRYLSSCRRWDFSICPQHSRTEHCAFWIPIISFVSVALGFHCSGRNTPVRSILALSIRSLRSRVYLRSYNIHNYPLLRYMRVCIEMHSTYPLSHWIYPNIVTPYADDRLMLNLCFCAQTGDLELSIVSKYPFLSSIQLDKSCVCWNWRSRISPHEWQFAQVSFKDIGQNGD